MEKNPAKKNMITSEMVHPKFNLLVNNENAIGDSRINTIKNLKETPKTDHFKKGNVRIVSIMNNSTHFQFIDLLTTGYTGIIISPMLASSRSKYHQKFNSPSNDAKNEIVGQLNLLSIPNPSRPKSPAVKMMGLTTRIIKIKMPHNTCFPDIFGSTLFNTGVAITAIIDNPAVILCMNRLAMKNITTFQSFH